LKWRWQEAAVAKVGAAEASAAAASAGGVLDALVVGAGFGGMCAGVRLQEAGARFVIVEQARDWGGTWRDNRYPGAACDVQSHLYSLSFFPWADWTREFAGQEEIWGYMRACVAHFGLGARARFGVRVVRAAWEARRAVWVVEGEADGAEAVEAVEGAGGRAVRWEARALIVATGGLSRPQWPALAGLEAFEGRAFHTARWPEGVALDGARVGVVGTGASAIQVVPAIAGRVGHLTVFQRTAPWVLPRPDRALSEGERAWMRRAPALRWLKRQALYWRLEARALGFVKAPWVMGLVERWGRAHIAAQVLDPALRARVTPTFRMGCKRILMSNDYYAALQRPNVALASAAARVTAGGVVDAEGAHHALDVLVFATGFEAAEALAPFEVAGEDGRLLNDVWRGRGGAEAYKGTTVAGFPNLFLIVGPNTGLGHSSMVFMIEAQVRYIMEALAWMRARGLAAVAVKPEAERRYNGGLQERLRRTIWASGCASWYQTRAGKNTTLWPGLTVGFWWQTRRFDPDQYVQTPHAPAR
jgi:cation diffusion facilitator CzcD-associated flavoprotein CzcO